LAQGKNHKQPCWLVMLFWMVLQILNNYISKLFLFRSRWRFKDWLGASQLCGQSNSVANSEDETGAKLGLAGRARLASAMSEEVTSVDV
jgi:hypothetical protein